MQGLVTLLPQPYHDQVKLLWQGLEDRFGLSYIRATPQPHFSWQIGESYQLAEAKRQLSRLVRNLLAFEVRVKGVAFFPGPLPVLYLKVVRSQKLMDLHHRLWGLLTPLTEQPHPYYAPKVWHPHITLAMNDLSPSALPEVTGWVDQFKVDWEFECANFTILGQYADGIACEQVRFECGKGLISSNVCDQ